MAIQPIPASPTCRPWRSKGAPRQEATTSARSGTVDAVSSDHLPLLNEKVFVWSRSSGEWRAAVVVDYVQNKTTRITVQYDIPGQGIAQKTLLPTSVNLRRVAHGSRSPATRANGDSLAATGWAPSQPEPCEEEGEGAMPMAQPASPTRQQRSGVAQAAPKDDIDVADPPGVGGDGQQLSRRDRASARGAKAVFAKQAAAAVERQPRQPDARPVPSASDDDPSEELMDGDLLAEGRFQLQHQLGSGSFSTVRLAKDLRTGGEVALKIESAWTKFPQLAEEARRYKVLAGGFGVPAMHWYGTHNGYGVLALELLGPSLELAFERCDRRFGLEAVVRLADQMLSCVESLHARGFVHRDLKPHNFCLGQPAERRGRVYILDFGLARRWRQPRSSGGGHVPFRRGQHFVGTVRYASLAAHRGEEQSRRDDLEALAYIFSYFLNGSLPWQDATGATKQERRQAVLQVKESVGAERLFAGAPPEFAAFFDSARSLDFEEEPDYEGLHRVLGAVDFPRSGESPSRRRGNSGSGSGDVLADLLDSPSAVSEEF